MEGDLLEISGEDADSLLLQHNQSPIGDVSTFNASLFSCSPLNFPESNPPDVKAVNPMHSSNADKENVNDDVINKSELPKLSLEPHQMKRKKKGGYNLRKSLAWDRAFFTEEGVLNSTELSLISGDFGKLNGGTLSVIEEEEEGRESLSGDSIDLQALENNLFKELPLNNSATTEEKKVGGSLLQKSSGSAPRSAVRQNVLSVHDVNRSGSKRSGCPRPVLSSALKRPANLNITKAATKEPKISKLPAPKPASSVLSTTFKSVPNINKPKRNQSAQAGSKKSTRSSQNDAKAGLSSRSQITKPSAQQAKRMVGSSALASPASTCSQNPLVTKADNVLKVKEDPVVAAGDRSINHEANSNKIATIPPNGAHSGGNTQYAQPRMAKPSGLRMPSPSLGFFSQSKTNASHNLRKSTQPSNQPKSNIPNLKKLCVLKSTCESTTSSMQVPTVSNGVAAITNPGVSSLASSVSSGVNSLCQDIRPTSQIPRVEVKVLCNSDNHQSMNNLHTFEDDIKLQIDENVKLLGTDDKILLKSQSSEQGKLDYKRRADMASSQTPNQIGDEFKYHNFVSPHSLQRKGTSKTNVGANQLSGNDQHGSLMEDSNLFPKLCPIDVNVNDIHGSSANDDQIRSMHGSHELPSKQAEQAKPFTFNNDQMVNETERPHINDSIMLKEGGASEGFLSYDGGQSTGISQKVRDSSASELERSNALSHCRDRIQGTDDAGEVADIDLKSHVDNAQIDSFEVDLSLENGNSLLNDSEANDPDLLADQVKEKLVEQQPLPDHDIVERVFQDNFGSQSTDCSLHEENFSSERILVESNLQSSKYVGAELADTSQNELGNSGAPLIPAEVKNGGHEMADAVQGLYVENAVSVSTDMLCNRGIEHLAEAKSEGLRTVEDQVTIAINACDIGVTDDGQSCGELVGNEIDKFHLLSHTSPVVQCKGYSEMDDIIGLKNVEGNQHILSAKCSSDIFEPEQINCCQVDNSVMLTGSSLDKQYDLEKPIAQAELVHSSEANISSQENQMPETHHSLLSLDGNFFQKSHGFDSDHANVDSKDKSTVRQVSEGPDLSHVECPDEPDEECGLVDEMTTRSFQEDAYCHSFDDSSRHLSSLAENTNSAMVVEDLNEPPEQDAVIVEEILSDKFQFSANEEVSCSVKIKVPDNSHDHYDDMIFRPDNEQSGQATSLNAVFSSVSEDELSGAGSTCNSQAFSSLIEEPTSLTGNVILEEVNISEKDVPQELNSALISVEAENRTTLSENNDGNDKKQDAAVIKPPPNAIPFSDEWLAAFEAAGEEILTIKSGAVQHSPKDKILPEPSPWSPVKRKNNQGIGPFDCTKYTNSNLPPPGSES